MPELLSVLWSLHVSSLEFSVGSSFQNRSDILPPSPGPATLCSISKLDVASIRGLVLACSYSGPNRHWMILDGISYAAYGIGSQTTWKPEDWFATLVLALTILGVFQWTDSIHQSINPGVLMNMRRLESEVIIRKEHENAIKINTRCCFIGFYCT